MAEPRKIGGYIWRQEVARAQMANKRARAALRRIVDERPGPQLTALLLSKAALALAENLDALQELERIIGNKKAPGRR